MNLHPISPSPSSTRRAVRTPPAAGLAAAAVALLALAACGGGSKAGGSGASATSTSGGRATTTTTRAEPGSTSKPTATTPVASGQAVMIKGFAFQPKRLSVKAGTTVTFTNMDSAPHTASSTATPSVFDAGTLNKGGTFSFTFRKPGTYSFECQIHTFMTGQIVVVP
ncbi:MAG: cupredoxin domain-containing protein [Actinobacteria bacterium]|nr:cupredoxin domain-containing protein [Actinomycetota bacterium]